MTLLKLTPWKLFVAMMLPASAGAALTLLAYAAPTMLILGTALVYIFLGVFITWTYQVASACSSRVAGATMSVYAPLLAFAALYRAATVAYTLWYGLQFHRMIDIERAAWIVPVHVSATAAALYCFYMNANWLVSAELKRGATFNETWRTFLLVLVFPVGLFFIQPRLQKLIGAM